MSANQEFASDRLGGAGDMEEEKEKANDLSDSDSEPDPEKARVSTTGDVVATTADPQTDVSTQDQMGDPSLSDVSLDPGNAVTAGESTGQGENEGALTVRNQKDGGTTVQVQGTDVPETQVKQGGKAVRVDQIEAVQEQVSQNQQQQSGGADTSGGGGSGGGDSGGDSPGGARPEPPGSSGMGFGSSGLGWPGGGGDGGLVDQLTSPLGLVLVAVAGVAVFAASNDKNDDNSGGSNSGA